MKTLGVRFIVGATKCMREHKTYVQQWTKQTERRAIEHTCEQWIEGQRGCIGTMVWINWLKLVFN